MRIRALLGGILGSVTVLVIGWQAGAAAAHDSAASTSSTSSTSGTTGTTGTSGTSSGGTSSSGASSLKDGSYTGTSEDTQFGAVQVKVVVSGGTITDVVALQLTDREGRSVQISNYAAPILKKEVLAAQSASVSSVGGATYTSEAYLSSLQSALDAARA